MALRRSAAPDYPFGWLAGHGWAARLTSARDVPRAHPPHLSQIAAMLADPAAALPYYPMVSHRGGYRDDS